MNLILASQSEGRKKLLSLFKIPFEVIPSTLDEDGIVSTSPFETIKLRAEKKGEDVADKINNNKDYLLISADSGAILENKLIGKPKDYADGKNILMTLSENTHIFQTSVFIFKISSGKIIKRYDLEERTLVTFRKLSDEDIKLYLDLCDYKKYAGGYALFATPQDFITRVEGSLSNVIGLPLEKIIPVLKENDLLK